MHLGYVHLVKTASQTNHNNVKGKEIYCNCYKQNHLHNECPLGKLESSECSKYSNWKSKYV